MSPSNERDVHEMTAAEHRVEYPAIASLEDMKLHRLPLNYRDLCSKSVHAQLPSLATLLGGAQLVKERGDETLRRRG